MNYYVDIFFRLINFGALLGVLAYGFKTYVLPSLQVQLASQDAHKEDLLSHQLVLESNHAEIDRCVEQETQLCGELREKISGWSSVVKKELHDRQDHKKEVAQRLQIDQQRQQERKIEQKLLDDVLSFAVEQSRKDLVVKFEDKNEQKKFMQSVLQFMQEHSS